MRIIDMAGLALVECAIRLMEMVDEPSMRAADEPKFRKF